MVPAVALGVAAILGSCTASRLPQTGFYCIDLPDGREGDADALVDAIAERLKFKVSKGQFASEAGPPKEIWEVYGGGVSLIIATQMHSGKPDQLGNRETVFNPNRLGFNVAKTGRRQRVRFDVVVSAAISAANQLDLKVKKAVQEECSTQV